MTFQIIQSPLCKWGLTTGNKLVHYLNCKAYTKPKTQVLTHEMWSFFKEISGKENSSNYQLLLYKTQNSGNLAHIRAGVRKKGSPTII